MEAKFTPGPWRLSHIAGESADVYVDADTHSELASVVWKMEDEDHSPTCEANAHLIAAAPELYAALMLEHALDMDKGNGEEILVAAGWDPAGRFEYSATRFVSDKRRAALAKAEGKS